MLALAAIPALLIGLILILERINGVTDDATAEDIDWMLGGLTLAATLPTMVLLLTTVNSDSGESWLSLHPDGRIAIFGRHVDGFGDQRIYLTAWNGATWSTPKLAPFAADMNERGARFSPDGESVIFASTRPIDADDTDNDWNIWSVAFENSASW